MGIDFFLDTKLENCKMNEYSFIKMMDKSTMS
jgi:hypothetical protein